MSGHEDLARGHEVETSSNRAFGWVFTIAFLLFGMWPLVSSGRPHTGLLLASAIVLLVTLTIPGVLALPNRLWLRLGELLSRVVSPLVLLFLFYAVVTPMGLVMRVLRTKEARRWRPDPNAGDTYWVPRNPPGPKPDSLNHQF